MKKAGVEVLGAMMLGDKESVVDIEIGESLTGLSITGSLGTPQINYDFKVTLTDSLLGTLSLGSLTTVT